MDVDFASSSGTEAPATARRTITSSESTAMPTTRAANRFGLTPEARRFLRKHAAIVAFWPLICALLAILMWLLLLSLYRSARSYHEEQALLASRQLAEVYAQQIARTIGEIDHVSALLKGDWERSGGRFRLDHASSTDAFVDTGVAAISLIDRNGIIVSSTLPGAVGMPVRDRGYFAFHRDNAAPGLHIGEPLPGRFMDKEIVTFSRRLSQSDGGFDGVICIATGTPFLAGFANASTLGQHGILALVGADGLTRAAKIGSRADSLLQPAVVPRAGARLLAAMAQPAAAGLFLDGEGR
jgi:hypothetical protein